MIRIKIAEATPTLLEISLEEKEFLLSKSKDFDIARENLDNLLDSGKISKEDAKMVSFCNVTELRKLADIFCKLATSDKLSPSQKEQLRDVSHQIVKKHPKDTSESVSVSTFFEPLLGIAIACTR